LAVWGAVISTCLDPKSQKKHLAGKQFATGAESSIYLTTLFNSGPCEDHLQKQQEAMKLAQFI
jgi:hypothetical protein